MIQYNNHNQIKEIHYNNHSIKYVYGCGGNLVWPTETVTSKVRLLNKTNMQWGDAPCNSSYTLTRDDIYTAWTDTKSGGNMNSNLIEAVVGDCVTVLEDNIFNYDYSLSAVTIPNTVTAIGNQAFLQTSNLKSITLPSNLVSIGINAFKLSGLQMSLILPYKLETIGSSAFSDCKLKNITIPNSVTKIGETAFYQSLESGESNPIQFVICRPTVPPTLGRSAFSDSKNNATYPIYVPDEAYEEYCQSTNWKNYADAGRLKPLSQKP